MRDQRDERDSHGAGTFAALLSVNASRFDNLVTREQRTTRTARVYASDSELYSPRSEWIE